jgi:hypothetical protein
MKQAARVLGLVLVGSLAVKVLAVMVTPFVPLVATLFILAVVGTLVLGRRNRL